MAAVQERDSRRRGSIAFPLVLTVIIIVAAVLLFFWSSTQSTPFKTENGIGKVLRMGEAPAPGRQEAVNAGDRLAEVEVQPPTGVIQRITGKAELLKPCRVGGPIKLIVRNYNNGAYIWSLAPDPCG